MPALWTVGTHCSFWNLQCTLCLPPEQGGFSLPHSLSVNGRSTPLANLLSSGLSFWRDSPKECSSVVLAQKPGQIMLKLIYYWAFRLDWIQNKVGLMKWVRRNYLFMGHGPLAVSPQKFSFIWESGHSMVLPMEVYVWFSIENIHLIALTLPSPHSDSHGTCLFLPEALLTDGNRK